MSSLKRVVLFVEIGIALLVVLAVTATATPTARASGSCTYQVVSPTPPHVTTTPTPPIPPEVSLRLQAIERRLDDMQTLVEVQSSVNDATVSRMESNLNLLLAILAIGSLLAAVLGFAMVRIWIRSLVENQLRQITSQEVSRVANMEMCRLREEWDPKFAELYQEYRRVAKGKSV